MSDAVNHPAYYNRGNVEVIDFIEDWRLDFSMGSFVKYISRAGHKKNAIEDLEKAKWYIRRFAEHPVEPMPEGWGTYGWREFAESQGCEYELCQAMDIAYLVYRGEEVPWHLLVVIALIDTVIERLKNAANNIEHGVLEMGSEN